MNPVYYFVGIPFGMVMLYISARLISTAYFKSKTDHIRETVRERLLHIQDKEKEKSVNGA